MSDSPYANRTDIEVVQTPGDGRRKNKLIKEGWTSPSVFTIETIGTMDSTKVADNLADFAENDEDSKKTWMRYFVEKFWMKVRLSFGKTILSTVQLETFMDACKY